MTMERQQSIDGLFTEIQMVAEQLNVARSRFWDLIEEEDRRQESDE